MKFIPRRDRGTGMTFPTSLAGFSGVLLLVLSLVGISPALSRGETGVDLPEVERLHQAGETYFEVFGTDLGSVQVVARISREAEAVLRGPLLLPNRFPQPVLVALRRPAEMRENVPFLIDRLAQDQVLVHLRWTRDTQPEDVRMALGLALLWRGLLWHRAELSSAEEIPVWLGRAVARGMAVNRFPAYDEGMAEYLWERGLPGLAEIVTLEGRSISRQEDYAAFQLWQFLQEEAPRRDRVVNALVRIASGEEATNAIFNSFSERVPDFASLEMWWQVGGMHRLNRRLRIQTPLATSRTILGDWSRVHLEMNDNWTVYPVREWWDLREEAAMRTFLEERLNLIASSLNRLHPFHFNPALSLARTIQAILRNDREAFRQSLAEWERDWAEAEELIEEVREVLDRWEGDPQR